MYRVQIASDEDVRLLHRFSGIQEVLPPIVEVYSLCSLFARHFLKRLMGTQPHYRCILVMAGPSDPFDQSREALLIHYFNLGPFCRSFDVFARTF